MCYKKYFTCTMTRTVAWDTVKGWPTFTRYNNNIRLVGSTCNVNTEDDCRANQSASGVHQHFNPFLLPPIFQTVDTKQPERNIIIIIICTYACVYIIAVTRAYCIILCVQIINGRRDVLLKWLRRNAILYMKYKHKYTYLRGTY